MHSSKRFRLAFYCSSLSWGGLEMNTLRHAEWMKERGHEVLLVCVKSTPLYKAAEKSKIRVITVKRSKKNFDFSSALSLKKILKKEGVEVVWFRDKRDLSTIGMAKTFSMRKRKVLYHQAMQIGVRKTHLIHTIRFNKIDAWVTPLLYLKEQIATRTKFNLKRVHVIPLAIDRQRFAKNGLNREDAREKFGFQSNDVVVGIIGRIDPHKAQQFVKNAVADLMDKHPTLKLLIVGNKTEGEWEDYYKTLKKDVRDNHSNGHVQLLPFMDDVTTFYNAIDVFVMSSAKETFGMVTIEAMMSGKKIIGSNTCGTLELLHDGKFGYYFTPNQPETFKVALLKILNNPLQAEKKSKAAQAYAETNFDHNNECNLLEEVLERITKK